MPDYSKGKVYKIVNSVNDTIYVGSTCQQLSARMGAHRANARNGRMQALYCIMRELGADKFRIILIEDFPCLNKSQLEAREFMKMHDAKSADIQLYNHMVDGRHSVETRQKISQANMGKKLSQQTREKMSEAQRGKIGTQAKAFGRGCVALISSNNAWRFTWQNNGKQSSKSFSVNKFGDSAAHAFALIHQDEIYPKVDDDKEFIEEIRARIQ